MLRCIGPRGNDIFKSFKFTGAKSKDNYGHVNEKFDACEETPAAIDEAGQYDN